MESKKLTICTPDYTQVPAHCPGRCQGGARQLLPHRCQLLSRPGHCQVEKVNGDEGGTSTEDHDRGEAMAGDLSPWTSGLFLLSLLTSTRSLCSITASICCPVSSASERARDQALFHCSSTPASQSWYQPAHLMLPSSEPQQVLPQRNERKLSDQMKLAFLD